MNRAESSALHRNEIGRNELDNGGLNKTEPDSAELKLAMILWLAIWLNYTARPV
jgi:hypothetical protein